MRLLLLVLALTLSTILAAPAQAQGHNRPIGSEPRYVGVDFPSWLVVQSVGTTTEVVRHAGTGAPICVPWETIVSVKADQVSCWCFSMSPNVTISAPTGDGGCQITDANSGPDGAGACIDTAGGERAWISPAWQIAARRPGARGFAGTVGGVCSVATTTTAGWGSALRVPCDNNQTCTDVVGSGTCGALASALPGATGATTDYTSRDLQYAQGCAYLSTVAAATGVAFVGSRR